MKRLSLQWRITIMTALLTCAACMLTNCLVGYTGMRYMDAIGSGISALSTADEDTPQAFDPTNVALDDEVTVVVNNAQESFGATAWCITAGVTLLGGVLAYFVSGRALKPLRAFAAQVERVQPDNLSEINLSEDVPTELQRCSASFNDMIGRLDEGFSAQRQFTGNAAHELRTPLALMQAQIELFASEHPTSQPQTAELLGLLQEQTERMSRMTKVLNLVENAIRYSRPGSTVNVSICDNDSHVFLRVEDQGPGIPKQYRESIFQPFFRLDKSRSRAYGGAGLGLALVWEIAALHGGTVEVEASSENGATMLTTLPKRTAA